MKCPIDGTPLVMTERYGVEIDYCPTCRGVWLDRGELDKIIERAVVQMTPPPPPQQGSRGYHPDPYSRPQGHSQKSRKKESFGGFIEDLFEF